MILLALLLSCATAETAEAPLRLAGGAGPLERAVADGGFRRLGQPAPRRVAEGEAADCAIGSAPGPGQVAVAALGAPGLLSCTPEALGDRGPAVEGLLAAYAARAAYERGLPVRERRRLDPGPGLPPDYQLSPAPGADPRWVRRALDRAAALPSPYPALAGQLIEGSPPARLIAVIDTDGDGRLSREEFSGVVRDPDPDTYDGDGDGFIDEAEVRAMLAELSPLLPSHRGFGRIVNAETHRETEQKLASWLRALKDPAEAGRCEPDPSRPPHRRTRRP